MIDNLYKKFTMADKTANISNSSEPEKVTQTINEPGEESESLDDSSIKIKPLRLNRTEKKRLKFERKRANHKQRKEEKKLKKKLANKNVKEEATSDGAETKKVRPTVSEMKYENFLNHRQLKERNRERLRQVYADGSKSLKVSLFQFNFPVNI